MNELFGNNKQLSPRQVKQGCVELMQKLAAKRNKKLPDIMELMESSDLVLLDAQGNRVDFERAILTWED